MLQLVLGSPATSMPHSTPAATTDAADRTCLTEGLCIEAVTVDAADQTITIAVS